MLALDHPNCTVQTRRRALFNSSKEREMLTKIACATIVLTVASMAPAHAGGLLGGLLSGKSNRSGLINVSPNVDLGVGNILSGNDVLNGNRTGLLSGILNGNRTSVDAIGSGNDNDRGYNKKKRHH